MAKRAPYYHCGFCVFKGKIMEKIFYSLIQLKEQARRLHKELKKKDYSYMQAMQLVAISYGFKNWETLEKSVLEAPLAVKPESSTEIMMDTMASNSLWVSVNNVSVNIVANDEAVNVSLYPLDSEDNKALSTISYNDNMNNNITNSMHDNSLSTSNVVSSNELINQDDLKDSIVDETYDVLLYNTSDDYENHQSELLADGFSDFEEAQEYAEEYAETFDVFYKIVVKQIRNDDSGDYVYVIE